MDKINSIPPHKRNNVHQIPATGLSNVHQIIGVRPIVKHFLVTTSVKGVGRFVKTGDNCLRALWLFTVVFGSSMAVYFLYKLFNLYTSHSVTTFLSEVQELAPFPDVTFCNLNPLANEDSLMSNLNEYDEMLNNLEITSEEHERLIGFLLEPTGVIQNSGLDSLGVEEFDNTFVTDCAWQSRASSPTVKKGSTTQCAYSAKVVFYSPQFGFCYTFSPVSNSTLGYTAIFYVDNFMAWHLSNFQMSFALPFAIGVRMVVHERGTVPVMEQGINVPVGYHATVRLQITRRKLLPAPYSTCVVNLSWPQEIGVNYQYSKAACQELCMQYLTIRRCDCISGDLISLPQMREKHHFCGKVLGTGADAADRLLSRLVCAEEVRDEYMECDRKCFQPCDEYRYQMKTFKAEWPHPSYRLAFYNRYIKGQQYDHLFQMYSIIDNMYSEEVMLNDTDEDIAYSTSFQMVQQDKSIVENFLQVTVQFDSDLITKMVDKPAVTLESLIGGLGGVLNLWIGISFVTVIELVEVIIKLCKSVYIGYRDKNKVIQISGKD